MVASGLYNNASEVVREALRLLIEREGCGADGRRGEPLPKAEIHVRLRALMTPLRERGITSLGLFGSVVRGEAGAGSDVDVLVDVDPAARFSLVDLIAVKRLLEERLGRDVDLVTKAGLDPVVRDRVLAESGRVF